MPAVLHFADVVMAISTGTPQGNTLSKPINLLVGIGARAPSSAADDTTATEKCTLKEFLESVPPGTEKKVSDLFTPSSHRGKLVSAPDIHLHCPKCGGVRTFSCDHMTVIDQDNSNYFQIYLCQNCKRHSKTFSLQCSTTRGAVTKFGEFPSFGPPTPPRAMSLIGGDRDLFLQGRRCELQGLGIGAFTYYRRVIEDQRNRIFDEIIRVLEKTDPANEVISDIRAAKNEQQFSKSIDAIKHALPSSLLVNGQNPLRLLHSAFSEGVHALSDEQCLALATAARTVLFEFSERLAQALSNDAALAQAVALLNKKKG